MTEMKREELIQKHIDLLGCSYAEAAQIVADDELIDKGGRCDWEPTVEEERAMRKATKLVADRKKPTAVKREKKENAPKRALMAILEQAIANSGVEVEVLNAERQLAFEYEGAKYEVTLIQKRK
jgi:hypothetical protein